MWPGPPSEDFTVMQGNFNYGTGSPPSGPTSKGSNPYRSGLGKGRRNMYQATNYFKGTQQQPPLQQPSQQKPPQQQPPPQVAPPKQAHLGTMPETFSSLHSAELTNPANTVAKEGQQMPMSMLDGFKPIFSGNVEQHISTPENIHPAFRGRSQPSSLDVNTDQHHSSFERSNNSAFRNIQSVASNAEESVMPPSSKIYQNTSQGSQQFVMSDAKPPGWDTSQTQSALDPFNQSVIGYSGFEQQFAQLTLNSPGQSQPASSTGIPTHNTHFHQSLPTQFDTRQETDTQKKSHSFPGQSEVKSSQTYVNADSSLHRQPNINALPSQNILSQPHDMTTNNFAPPSGVMFTSHEMKKNEHVAGSNIFDEISLNSEEPPKYAANLYPRQAPPASQDLSQLPASFGISLHAQQTISSGPDVSQQVPHDNRPWKTGLQRLSHQDDTTSEDDSELETGGESSSNGDITDDENSAFEVDGQEQTFIPQHGYNRKELKNEPQFVPKMYKNQTKPGDHCNIFNPNEKENEHCRKAGDGDLLDVMGRQHPNHAYRNKLPMSRPQFRKRPLGLGESHKGRMVSEVNAVNTKGNVAYQPPQPFSPGRINADQQSGPSGDPLFNIVPQSSSSQTNVNQLHGQPVAPVLGPCSNYKDSGHNELFLTDLLNQQAGHMATLPHSANKPNIFNEVFSDDSRLSSAFYNGDEEAIGTRSHTLTKEKSAPEQVEAESLFGRNSSSQDWFAKAREAVITQPLSHTEPVAGMEKKEASSQLDIVQKHLSDEPPQDANKQAAQVERTTTAHLKEIHPGSHNYIADDGSTGSVSNGWVQVPRVSEQITASQQLPIREPEQILRNTSGNIPEGHKFREQMGHSSSSVAATVQGRVPNNNVIVGGERQHQTSEGMEPVVAGFSCNESIPNITRTFGSNATFSLTQANMQDTFYHNQGGYHRSKAGVAVSKDAHKDLMQTCMEVATPSAAKISEEAEDANTRQIHSNTHHINSKHQAEMGLSSGNGSLDGYGDHHNISRYPQGFTGVGQGTLDNQRPLSLVDKTQEHQLLSTGRGIATPQTISSDTVEYQFQPHESPNPAIHKTNEKNTGFTSQGHSLTRELNTSDFPTKIDEATQAPKQIRPLVNQATQQQYYDETTSDANISLLSDGRLGNTAPNSLESRNMGFSVNSNGIESHRQRNSGIQPIKQFVNHSSSHVMQQAPLITGQSEHINAARNIQQFGKNDQVFPQEQIPSSSFVDPGNVGYTEPRGGPLYAPVNRAVKDAEERGQGSTPVAVQRSPQVSSGTLPQQHNTQFTEAQQSDFKKQEQYHSNGGVNDNISCQVTGQQGEARALHQIPQANKRKSFNIDHIKLRQSINVFSDQDVIENKGESNTPEKGVGVEAAANQHFNDYKSINQNQVTTEMKLVESQRSLPNGLQQPNKQNLLPEMGSLAQNTETHQPMQNIQHMVDAQLPQQIQAMHMAQQVHGAQAPQQMQGVQPPQQIQGVQMPQQIQGPQHSQQTQGPQSPQQIQGAQMPQQMQGEQVPQQIQEVQPPQQIQGVPMPQQMQGQQPSQQTQGQQSPQQIQGVQMPQQMQGEQAPQQIQGLQPPHQIQGVQMPKQIQGLQGPHQMQGVQGPHQMQGVQGPHQMQGVQGPHQIQGVQLPQQVQEEQIPHQMQGVQLPHQMQGVQATQQMPGVQAPQLMQGVHVPQHPQGNIHGPSSMTNPSFQSGNEATPLSSMDFISQQQVNGQQQFNMAQMNPFGHPFQAQQPNMFGGHYPSAVGHGMNSQMFPSNMWIGGVPPNPMMGGYYDWYYSHWPNYYPYGGYSHQNWENMSEHSNNYSYASSQQVSEVDVDSRPPSALEMMPGLLETFVDESQKLDFYKEATPPPMERLTPLHFTRPHVVARTNRAGLMLITDPCHPLDGMLGTVHRIPSGRFLPQLDLKNFPGPLIVGETSKKSVISFARWKATELMKLQDTKEGRAKALLWEYCALLVQRNGAVDGSDVSDLIMHRAVDVPYTQSEGIKSPAMKEINTYRSLMMQGSKRDAVNYAMNEGMWGHAFALAYMSNPRTMKLILSKFLSTIDANDPLTTLYSHLGNKGSGSYPYIVKGGCDWIQHLCILLANPSANKEADTQGIVALGDALVEDNQVSGAHFCYLLSGYQPKSFKDKETKMCLLSQEHRGKGSKTNLWATDEAIQLTEIFEYAARLQCKEGFIVPFQHFKLIYARRLLDHGLMAEAAAYLQVIAEALLLQPSAYSVSMIADVAQLSQKVTFTSVVTLEEVPEWIDDLMKLAKEGIINTTSDEQLSSSSADHHFSKKVTTSQYGKEQASVPSSDEIDVDTDKSADIYPSPSEQYSGPYRESEYFHSNGSEAMYDQGAQHLTHSTVDGYQMEASTAEQDSFGNYNHYDPTQYMASGVSQQGQQEYPDPTSVCNQNQAFPQLMTDGHNQVSLGYNTAYGYQQGYGQEVPNVQEHIQQADSSAMESPDQAEDVATDEEDLFEVFKKKNRQTRFSPEDDTKSGDDSSSKSTPKKEAKDKPPSTQPAAKKGWVSSIISKVLGSKSQEVHLPPGKMTMYFDAKLNRWVDPNEPEEEKVAPPPPPTMGYRGSTSTAGQLPMTSHVSTTQPSQVTLLSQSAGFASEPAATRGDAAAPVAASLTTPVLVSAPASAPASAAVPAVTAVPASAIAPTSAAAPGVIAAPAPKMMDPFGAQDDANATPSPPSIFSRRAHGMNRRGARYINTFDNVKPVDSTPIPGLFDPMATSTVKPMNFFVPSQPAPAAE